MTQLLVEILFCVCHGLRQLLLLVVLSCQIKLFQCNRSSMFLVLSCLEKVSVRRPRGNKYKTSHCFLCRFPTLESISSSFFNSVEE